MKYLVGLLFVGACGASQQQIESTPTATTPRVHEEAPAASTSDLDRYGLRQTFQDMENAQNAYREIRNERGEAAGSAAGSAVVPPPPPKKTGPAEQAPKTGPAEEAPKS
jgi:hypothetical protein